MKHTSLALVALLALGGPALAAEITITQQDKQFDKAEVSAKVGDRLVFRNDDKTAHNVHSATDGHRFDLGLQRAGDSSTLVLDKTGTFVARCAIHPKMKLEVSVQK